MEITLHAAKMRWLLIGVLAAMLLGSSSERAAEHRPAAQHGAASDPFSDPGQNQ